MTARDEFALIAELFAPLAAGAPLAYGLTDDAAAIRPEPGVDLIVTADAIVAGVHFLPEDPPTDVARKLLRVNLSDLAAKGAAPFGYVMTTAWPRGVADGWIRAFAGGLADDQAAFGVTLLGGDTVATPGPMTLSLTAFGTLPQGQMLRRSGARPGDLVYASGTLGDGALGLRVLQGQAAGLDDASAAFLAQRYRVPDPRTALGPMLRGIATAALDCSDGLVADLRHLCRASSADAYIEAAWLPLSRAGRAALALHPDWRDLPATGGDDYEIIFTAPPAAASAVSAASSASGVPVTVIGRIEGGTGQVTLLDADGRPVATGAGGFRHF